MLFVSRIPECLIWIGLFHLLVLEAEAAERSCFRVLHYQVSLRLDWNRLFSQRNNFHSFPKLPNKSSRSLLSCVQTTHSQGFLGKRNRAQRNFDPLHPIQPLQPPHPLRSFRFAWSLVSYVSNFLFPSTNKQPKFFTWIMR